MKRLQGILAGMCMAALALGPGLAHAQVAENTPEACNDRVDNDNDGYVDCYDPDCRYLQFCQAPAPAQPAPQQYQPPQQQYQPPPQQYQPPPQQYQPPPQQYQPYQPYRPYTPPPRPPSNGVGALVVGAIFLPLGIGLVAGSVPLWNNASFTTTSGTKYANAWGAVTMDIFGAAMIVLGAILLPTGIVQMSKYSKWKREHAGTTPTSMFRLRGVGIDPLVSAGTNGGSAGLRLTF